MVDIVTQGKTSYSNTFLFVCFWRWWFGGGGGGIFSEAAYFTVKPIFHKAINLFELDSEITLESVSETNQY